MSVVLSGIVINQNDEVVMYIIVGMNIAHAVLARAGKGGVPGNGGADLLGVHCGGGLITM